jgi:hypothetical protein
MEKRFGSSVKDHISLARLARGSREFNVASNEEIADVIRAWEKHASRNSARKERDD